MASQQYVSMEEPQASAAPPAVQTMRDAGQQGAATTASAAAGEQKVTAVNYVLHEHSLLALFVTSSEAPGADVGGGSSSACAACCMPMQDLDLRQRLWFFFFLFSSSIVLSVEVTLGMDNQIESILKSTFIVLPIAMIAKSNISKLDSCELLGGVVKPMELALFAYVCWALYGVFTEGGEKTKVEAALLGALSAWVHTMVVEAVTLVAFYYCCCCFCVPSEYKMRESA